MERRFYLERLPPKLVELAEKLSIPLEKFYYMTGLNPEILVKLNIGNKIEQDAHFGVSEVEAVARGLEPGIFSNFPELTYLNLSTVPLKTNPESLLEGLHNLKYLYLNNMGLQDVEQDMLQEVPADRGTWGIPEAHAKAVYAGPAIQPDNRTSPGVPEAHAKHVRIEPGTQPDQ